MHTSLYEIDRRHAGVSHTPLIIEKSAFSQLSLPITVWSPHGPLFPPCPCCPPLTCSTAKASKFGGQKESIGFSMH